jgi:hypothetical protein
MPATGMSEIKNLSDAINVYWLFPGLARESAPPVVFKSFFHIRQLIDVNQIHQNHDAPNVDYSAHFQEVPAVLTLWPRSQLNIIDA